MATDAVNDVTNPILNPSRINVNILENGDSHGLGIPQLSITAPSEHPSESDSSKEQSPTDTKNDDFRDEAQKIVHEVLVKASATLEQQQHQSHPVLNDIHPVLDVIQESVDSLDGGESAEDGWRVRPNSCQIQPQPLPVPSVDIVIEPSSPTQPDPDDDDYEPPFYQAPEESQNPETSEEDCPQQTQTNTKRSRSDRPSVAWSDTTEDHPLAEDQHVGSRDKDKKLTESETEGDTSSSTQQEERLIRDTASSFVRELLEKAILEAEKRIQQRKAYGDDDKQRPWYRRARCTIGRLIHRLCICGRAHR